MEIINDPHTRKPCNSARNIYLGGVLIAGGIVWLCYKLDIIGSEIFDRIFNWPVLLMVVGGYFLSRRKVVAGIVPLAVGAAFALPRMFGIWTPATELLLPMTAIALGVALLLQK